MRSHKKDFIEWAKGTDIVLNEIEGCPLRVGDFVTFTNDFGVEFHHCEVLGFASPEYMKANFPSCEETRVFIDSDSYWFPDKLSQLTKE